ncbi:unnamed protein product [Didymodactylos carnosus]|uniref:Uncharacterized protein n=1 Tax=Didymodactylos carnosus TaxID=1234261 RepID=A0A815FWZ5_9BILA|nr:unnamed protein product [Didymodactylos carnosus]CAF4184426.1 unnamed protein product [Didymodactylos carnosus]
MVLYDSLSAAATQDDEQSRHKSTSFFFTTTKNQSTFSNRVSMSSYGVNNDLSKQMNELSRQQQHTAYHGSYRQQDNIPEKMDQYNSSIELQYFKKKSKTAYHQAETTMSGSNSTLGPTLATDSLSNGPSQQARRYAETRFPFPPFMVKFTQDVKEQGILNELDDYFAKVRKIKLELDGHRLKQRRELLLFVKNRHVFLVLFDTNNWPTTLDIKSIQIIDELLKKKYLYFNHQRYALTDDEYLCPARVLVCSKCYEIGHFRSACMNKLDECRTCGKEARDIKLHADECDGRQSCVRCKGQHESSDVRCPIIKSYRAVLTKSLLSPKDMTGDIRYRYNPTDFPLLDSSVMDHGGVNDRISKLEHNVNQLNDNPQRLLDVNNKLCEQQKQTQDLSMNFENMLQIDISFHYDFISQFETPICQTIIKALPPLVC